MSKLKPNYLAGVIFAFFLGLFNISAAAEAVADIDMTWIEKYITYRQDHFGQLFVTDYHFLAEIIYANKSTREKTDSYLFVDGVSAPIASYKGNDPFAFTNGMYYTRKSKSYNDLASLEAAHPATNKYFWEIHGPGGKRRLDSIRIGGSEYHTQIPDVSLIYLSQSEEPVTKFTRLNPDISLKISWDPFTTGRRLKETSWDDMIFVLVSDCHGRDVFSSGAPEDSKGFVDFNQTSTEMPEKLLEPGMNYVVFISEVHYVDANVSHGVDQLAVNSFAVELAVKTTGMTAPGRTCPVPFHKAPYLWSRKTPENEGLLPWRTFLVQPEMEH